MTNALGAWAYCFFSIISWDAFPMAIMQLGGVALFSPYCYFMNMVNGLMSFN